ncbi:MAG: hypothetical protein WCG91_03255 [Candidatus Shapirobacteria bacterium]
MLTRFEGEIRVVDFDQFERRQELESFNSICRDGFTVVCHHNDGQLVELENFLLCNTQSKGRVLHDGSRILIKRSMSVIKFNKLGHNYYHLLPMGLCFGFLNCPVKPSLGLDLKKMYDPEKILLVNKIVNYQIIDNKENSFWDVEELEFVNENPYEHNLFNNDKKIKVFMQEQEVGLLYKGIFSPSEKAHSNKVNLHPVAGWILQSMK